MNSAALSMNDKLRYDSSSVLERCLKSEVKLVHVSWMYYGCIMDEVADGR